MINTFPCQSCAQHHKGRFPTDDAVKELALASIVARMLLGLPDNAYFHISSLLHCTVLERCKVQVLVEAALILLGMIILTQGVNGMQGLSKGS